MPRTSTKRQQLVTAAVEQLHEVGFARTSIADVAEAAHIPMGNVYYYFKTKSELALAVARTWQQRLENFFGELDKHSAPLIRVQEFLSRAVSNRSIYVSFGCPLANLARDLRQEEKPLQAQAATIFALPFTWLEKQFRELGFSSAISRQHSRFVLSGVQGAIVLAHAQNDDSIIKDEVRQLNEWLVGLTKKGTSR